MVVSILLLLVGVFAGACSIVFIKASTIHPVLLASYRLIAAGIILLPVYFISLRRQGRKLSFSLIRPSLLPGLFLGLHFIFWNFGARMTTAANGTLIVNMTPVLMPFVAYAMFKEMITFFEALGTVIAIGGVILLGSADFSLGREHFTGDILCFAAMAFATVYLALSRRNNSGSGIWVYIVPLYLTGGIFSFIVSLFFTHPLEDLTGKNILMVLGLAAVSTVGGHTILNISMRRLRSQLVSLINLAQILFGALLGFLFFQEIPSLMFFIALPIILSGTVLAILFVNRGTSSGRSGPSGEMRIR